MSRKEPGAPEAELNAADGSPKVDAVGDSAVPEVHETAAYAAAASASSNTADAKTDVDASSQSSPLSESREHVLLAGGGHGESELATAWANWRQIRESVVGSQLSSEMSDTVAELKESGSELQPQPHLDSSPTTEEETSEISNIVDSVLADLKPKLMAEIARKMGKEKKK
jgi:hypothetical protein